MKEVFVFLSQYNDIDIDGKSRNHRRVWWDLRSYDPMEMALVWIKS